ncbi:toll/interleukin-1 receptor domain-containing protein [Pinirhizobacter soli]|uniref:toll/interleukin-1 receptor domain-containing protein n=1 Tax=Pinirhizobacter soli TaxID=2786953 RepID=UPI00202AB3C5|nr:toll/interleukin-1 receptor domain-containing protein [Pinirhizobacter soli]
MSDFRYRAFISYSHQDKAWAGWLHRALETYVIPKRLVGTETPAGIIPRRWAPIFRDSDELASAGDLGRKVNEALAQSDCLIVICSPDAARSRWVNEEVLAFKRLGRSDRIFCLVVAGEPNASLLPGREAEECFAPALRHRIAPDHTLSSDTVEPMAADVRAGKDTRANAKYKLIAGMLDIDFDALKRRELQRRTRRTAMLAAVALCVMAVTTVLAIVAFVARHEAVVASHAAERRQKQAEDLVSFMLGDLNDKLAQASRLDIMESVDDKAMAYFQAQPTADVNDQALEQRAVALGKIGSVRLDQGRLSLAMEAFQASLALTSRLAGEAPADIGRQLAHADTWSYIGMIGWRQGKLDDAERSFASGQAILERAAARAPDDARVAFQRITFHNNMGHVMEARGQLDAAARQYQDMLTLAQHLATAAPGNIDWPTAIGEASNNLGRLALLHGDLANAVAQYMAAETIQMGLAAANPKDASRRDDLLTVHAIVGRTQALAGDVQPGMDRLQRAVDMAAQLKVLDPGNTDYQEHQALYAIQLGRLHRLTGDMAGAAKLAREALVIFEGLARHDADNAVWQREYAEALVEQSAQSRASGDADAARRQATSALHLLDPLFKQQPDDRATLLAIVASRLSLAAVAADATAAGTLRNDALASLQSARSGQGDPRLLALQAITLLSLERRAEAMPVVKALWASGYRDPALLKVLRDEQIDYPQNLAFQRELLAATGGHAELTGSEIARSTGDE